MFGPNTTLAATQQQLQDEINVLNRSLDDQKSKISELENKSAVYKKSIEEKSRQAATLRNQMSILDSQIQKKNIDIQIKERQIGEQQLAIKATGLAILQDQTKIEKNKKRIGYLIRNIHRQDQKPYLELLLTTQTISDFFTIAEATMQVERDMQNLVNTVQKNQQELEQKKDQQEAQKQELEKLAQNLDQQKGSLEDQNIAKADLLLQTQNSERVFQSLLAQLKREQQTINNDIVSIERNIRAKLNQKSKEEGLQYLVGEKLMWPVPKNTITAYFHDPDYPFRRIFEHPAIDIRASQGTLVKAASSGYVARVQRDPGCAGKYAYVMIVHADGLSTVYGHLSSIQAQEDQFIHQGDSVGASGAQPGSCGAGKLTTGPHMHFEVRLNGIPVDPLNYLP